MADEKKQGAGETAAEEGQQKKGSRKMLLLVAAGVLLLLVAGGAAGYMYLAGDKEKPGEAQQKEKAGKTKTVLYALDPFVLNLAEQGRFLKVSMQMELIDAAVQPTVNERTPQIRDAFITLVSSKSADSLANPEGKFQLKDELLLRANQAVGKDVVRNLYFTEFIMQ